MVNEANKAHATLVVYLSPLQPKTWITSIIWTFLTRLNYPVIHTKKNKMQVWNKVNCFIHFRQLPACCTNFKMFFTFWRGHNYFFFWVALDPDSTHNLTMQDNVFGKNNNYAAVLPHEPLEFELKHHGWGTTEQNTAQHHVDNMTPSLLLGLSSSMTSRWLSGLDTHTTV